VKRLCCYNTFVACNLSLPNTGIAAKHPPSYKLFYATIITRNKSIVFRAKNGVNNVQTIGGMNSRYPVIVQQRLARLRSWLTFNILYLNNRFLQLHTSVTLVSVINNHCNTQIHLPHSMAVPMGMLL